MSRPLPIRWTCGVVPGHSHATEVEAALCIQRHTVSSPYGWCPHPGCFARGLLRERRPFGNDTCEAGHVYPTRDAVVVVTDPHTAAQEALYGEQGRPQ